MAAGGTCQSARGRHDTRVPVILAFHLLRQALRVQRAAELRSEEASDQTDAQMPKWPNGPKLRRAWGFYYGRSTVCATLLAAGCFRVVHRGIE